VYATHEIAEHEAEPVLLCAPSDHVIGEGFQSAASEALDAATETGGLVTIGLEPTRPATAYGYIRPGHSEDGYAPVDDFHEKPARSTAETLIERGARWNAGIFAWQPRPFLDAARLSSLEPLVEALEHGSAAEGFETVPAVSVDDAILERAANAYMVPASFPWDDLGSWDALERVLAHRENSGSGEATTAVLGEAANAVLGDALTIDAAGNVIASDDKHVSVVGVEDLVIAAYDDRVLVIPKERSQEVRSVVASLREQGRF
jgi:mannose-1-phosphate guanylyltransferase